jgi:hypothetical protein
MFYEYRQVQPRFPDPSNLKRFELDEGFELVAVSDSGDRMPRGVVLWGRRAVEESGKPVSGDGPTLEYKSLFANYLGFGNGQHRIPEIMNKEQGLGWQVVGTTDAGLYPPIGLTLWLKREKFKA